MTHPTPNEADREVFDTVLHGWLKFNHVLIGLEAIAAHRLAAYRAGLEDALAVIESGKDVICSTPRHQRKVFAAAIRALAEEPK